MAASSGIIKDIVMRYEPERLIDTVSAWLSAKNDMMLAKALKLSPGIIQGIRSGRIPVRPSILVAMAECTGKSVDELRRILGDRRGRFRMPSIARQG
jgi:antitoxin HigA-1